MNKNGVGKYLLRAVKYFIFIFVFFVILICIIFYTSQHDPGLMPWDMFKGNEKNLLLFFIVFSFAYPFIGYGRREVPVGKHYDEHKAEIQNMLAEAHMNFVREDKDFEGSTMIYHHRNMFIRFMRLFEDTLKIRYINGVLQMEGIRADVVRFSHNIEWIMQKAEEKAQEKAKKNPDSLDK